MAASGNMQHLDTAGCGRFSSERVKFVVKKLDRSICYAKVASDRAFLAFNKS